MPHPKGVVKALQQEKQDLEARRDATHDDEAKKVLTDRIKQVGESIKHYDSKDTKRFATAPAPAKRAAKKDD